MKYIKLFWRQRILAAFIVLLFACSFGAIIAAPAYAVTSKDAVCSGAGLTTGTCAAPQGTPDLNHTISLAINIFSWIVGIVAVIMIIVGGFKFVTSQGEASNISSARSTILYAIVGLVIVLLAQIIVRFVFHKTTGR